jgi:hypothetical protein
MAYALENGSGGWFYAGLILFTAIFLRAGIALVRRRKVDSRTYADTRTTGFVVMFVSAIAAGIIAHRMFMRFRSVEIKFSHLELGYCRPRQPDTISRVDYQRTEVIRGNDGTAQIFIFFAGGRVLKSVRFDLSREGERLVSELNAWKFPVPEP